MGPFGAAAVLLVAAAVKYPSEYSTALVGAGLVTFGAWLAVEIAAVLDRHYDGDHHKDDQ
jgi:hypothetical protein